MEDPKKLFAVYKKSSESLISQKEYDGALTYTLQCWELILKHPIDLPVHYIPESVLDYIKLAETWSRTDKDKPVALLERVAAALKRIHSQNKAHPNVKCSELASLTLTYTAIGRLQLHNLPKSKAAFEKAIAIGKANLEKMSMNLPIAYLHLSDTCGKLGEHRLAAENAISAACCCGEGLDNCTRAEKAERLAVQAIAYFNAGVHHGTLKNKAVANKMYAMAIELKRDIHRNKQNALLEGSILQGLSQINAAGIQTEHQPPLAPESDPIIEADPGSLLLSNSVNNYFRVAPTEAIFMARAASYKQRNKNANMIKNANLMLAANNTRISYLPNLTQANGGRRGGNSSKVLIWEGKEKTRKSAPGINGRNRLHIHSFISRTSNKGKERISVEPTVTTMSIEETRRSVPQATNDLGLGSSMKSQFDGSPRKPASARKPKNESILIKSLRSKLNDLCQQYVQQKKTTKLRGASPQKEESPFKLADQQTASEDNPVNDADNSEEERSELKSLGYCEWSDKESDITAPPFLLSQESDSPSKTLDDLLPDEMMFEPALLEAVEPHKAQEEHKAVAPAPAHIDQQQAAGGDLLKAELLAEASEKTSEAQEGISMIVPTHESEEEKKEEQVVESRVLTSGENWSVIKDVLEDKKEENKGVKEEENKGVKEEENKGVNEEENKGVKEEEKKGVKEEEKKGVNEEEKKGEEKQNVQEEETLKAKTATIKNHPQKVISPDVAARKIQGVYKRRQLRMSSITLPGIAKIYQGTIDLKESSRAPSNPIYVSIKINAEKRDTLYINILQKYPYKQIVNSHKAFLSTPEKQLPTNAEIKTLWATHIQSSPIADITQLPNIVSSFYQLIDSKLQKGSSTNPITHPESMEEEELQQLLFVKNEEPGESAPRQLDPIQEEKKQAQSVSRNTESMSPSLPKITVDPSSPLKNPSTNVFTPPSRSTLSTTTLPFVSHSLSDTDDMLSLFAQRYYQAFANDYKDFLKAGKELGNIVFRKSLKAKHVYPESDPTRGAFARRNSRRKSMAHKEHWKSLDQNGSELGNKNPEKQIEASLILLSIIDVKKEGNLLVQGYDCELKRGLIATFQLKRQIRMSHIYDMIDKIYVKHCKNKATYLDVYGSSGYDAVIVRLDKEDSFSPLHRRLGKGDVTTTKIGNSKTDWNGLTILKQIEEEKSVSPNSPSPLKNASNHSIIPAPKNSQSSAALLPKEKFIITIIGLQSYFRMMQSKNLYSLAKLYMRKRTHLQLIYTQGKIVSGKLVYLRVYFDNATGKYTISIYDIKSRSTQSFVLKADIPLSLTQDEFRESLQHYLDCIIYNEKQKVFSMNDAELNMEDILEIDPGLEGGDNESKKLYCGKRKYYDKIYIIGISLVGPDKAVIRAYQQTSSEWTVENAKERICEISVQFNFDFLLKNV